MQRLRQRPALSVVCLCLLALLTAYAARPAAAAAPSAFDPASVCPYGSPPAYSSSPANTAVAFEAEVVRLVNLERARYGLWPLTGNATLSAVARAHGQDMATRNYFAHITPEGKRPAQRAEEAGYPVYGWGDAFVGENIAGGQTTPATALAGWMTSEGHCKSILNPKYREIGTGYLASPGSEWKHYWTMNLGSAPMSLPVQINGGAATTKSREVTLNLTAETVSDWGSLAALVSYEASESPDFAGAVAQPFPAGDAPTASFTLSPSAGQKTVYVRYRDANGQTAVASATIGYEAPPTVPSKLTFLQDANRAHTQALVSIGGSVESWTASDNVDWLSLSPASGSGAVQFIVEVDASALALGTHSAVLTIATQVNENGVSIQSTTSVPVQLVISEQVSETYLPLAAGG
jgi:uncharacterized protein YkwD